MANYWAYNLLTHKWAAYTNIETVAYADDVVYEGDHHSFEMPMQALNTAVGSNAFVIDEAAAHKSSDSVMKVDPRHTATKRSIISLTDADGKVYKLFRDQLMNGCIQNVDPYA